VIPDGSGDFTNIQSAINALPVGGGKIFIRNGTYTLSGLLITSDNVTLEGEGWETIIRGDPTDDLIRIFNTTGVVIKNLALLNDGASCCGHRTIEIDTAQNVLIENVLFDSPGSNTERQLWMTESSNITIENCKFQNNTTEAIFTWQNVDNLKIVDSTFDNTAGMKFTAGENLIITGNYINNNSISGTSGIWSTHTKVTVGNNVVENCPAQAIAVMGNDGVVSGNVVTNIPATGTGIYSDAVTERLTVTGNTVNGGYNGIFFSSGKNNVFSNNTIVGASNNGIRLLNVETSVVSGNQISQTTALKPSISVEGCTKISVTGNVMDGLLAITNAVLTGTGDHAFFGNIYASVSVTAVDSTPSSQPVAAGSQTLDSDDEFNFNASGSGTGGSGPSR